MFGDLKIKGKTSLGSDKQSIDWYYQNIEDAIENDSSFHFFDKCEDMEKGGASMPMDFDCEQRDGLFDEAQLFAVWEKEDVKKLIERLQRAYLDAFEPDVAKLL